MSVQKKRRKVWLRDFTYGEVSEALERPNVVVLPVGSTEQHGRHLPLDVDIRIAASMCEAAALKVDESISVVVAPPLPFGISEHHMRFAGSIALEPETFIAVLYEVGRSLVRHGFQRLVIVNGHGGNHGALQIVATKLRVDDGARSVVYLSEWALAHELFMAIRESAAGGAAHACEYETSVYLHLQPELVKMEEAVCEMPDPLVDGTVLDLFSPGPYTAALSHDLSESGVLGDPTVASAEKGEALFAAAVDNLAGLLCQVART